MDFHGFQKMTLLDFPGKVACTVFTGGCNLRCPFCHNALLVTQLESSDVISDFEVLSFLEKRKGLLDGICITGGEPLLHNSIECFIKKVKELGFLVKLDTNGCYPERLKNLVEQNLVDYVAVDIKNSKVKYQQTVGIQDFDISSVEETVDYLLEGHVDYEFRTTIVQEFHTTQDIVDVAKWIKGAPRYFLQNFIDSGNLICNDMHEVERETIYKMCEMAKEFIPETQIRGI